MEDRMSKWFAIQLVVSDRPFHLDSMPRLDVFTLYRLYVVQGRLGTNPCHALRLGFFSEQQVARKICEDMHALFRFASVVQVTAAEQARFEKAPHQEAAPQKARQIESSRSQRMSGNHGAAQAASWFSRLLGRSLGN
jgi:hypothetical protein